MGEEKRFVVKKEANKDVITYMEYEKLKGFNVKPKNNLKFEDMINVNEMIIINPSLIEKLIDKKCRKKLEKLLLMLSIVDEDDSDDTSGVDIILDELEKFKSILESKYKEYMKKEAYEVLLKKLQIIKSELDLRKSVKLQLQLEEVRKSKPKR